MLSNIFGSCRSTLSTSAVNYVAINSDLATLTTTEGNRISVLPAAMTLQNLYVSINAAPGAGKSYTFTVRKNSADTAISVVIADSDTTGVYSGAAVSFAAGDIITLSITPSGTPTAPTVVLWNLQADSGGSHFAQILGGCGSTTNLSTSAASYANMFGHSNNAR
jgi:hypothetical protein